MKYGEKNGNKTEMKGEEKGEVKIESLACRGKMRAAKVLRLK